MESILLKESRLLNHLQRTVPDKEAEESLDLNKRRHEDLKFQKKRNVNSVVEEIKIFLFKRT